MAEEQSGSPQDLREKIACALFDASGTDTAGLTPEDRAQSVVVAMAALDQRSPGQVSIQLAAADGQPGRRRMMLAICNDDMPFLVDSVAAAVGDFGLTIARLLHPIVSVERDGAGILTAFRASRRGPGTRESLIVLEIERAPAKIRQALVERLHRVLADVRVAVSDWEAMIAATRAAARALNDHPPAPPQDAGEAIAFLEWLASDRFTLLGSDASAPGGGRSQPLGILRERADPRLPLAPPGDEPIAILKSEALATVHRRVPLDVIIARTYDAAGRVTGDRRLVGLFTSAALSQSPRLVPIIRRKVGTVIEHLGFDPRGHAGKALTHVLETFPREELFQVGTARLEEMALGLLSLLDRPRPKLFARIDQTGRAASVLVYVPRDLYTAELRQHIAALLQTELGAHVLRFDVELRAEGLARVHYLMASDRAINIFDEAALDDRLTALVRGWLEAVDAALAEVAGPARAARLTISHARAASTAYRAEFSPAEAAQDILRLSSLGSPDDRDVLLWRRDDDAPATLRAKVYRLRDVIPLSEMVPVFENFGFRVIEEFAYDLGGGRLGWIHDFRLELPGGDTYDLATLRDQLEPALAAVLGGTGENDAFNTLITAGLTARAAGWLRAYFRYLRQTGVAYGLQTMVDALRRHPAAAQSLIALFTARHDIEVPDRGSAIAAAHAALDTALAAITAIDEDRILRLYRSVIEATLRTNAFAPTEPEALAFKLDSHGVPGLPPPVPWREIWVYSPRVEGIHLRGGPIARGGLRWSDRRDDFRTEVLGLVKAQLVKNAVIVPTGAKGGFYPKRLPAAADRDAWLAEGTESYRVFIRALLSLTDNLATDGSVVPPANVIRHDADDPYLVVAADKGTATFSDVANAIAVGRGFWLGDAFASGGGQGYDHKAMGITARGAWISVQRHFAERGRDVQTEPLTVVGVGDMSGDVFGNGMLLSQTIRLVAAFDHRHIFLDPNPDPAVSFAERQRLFALPRSSWADYDPTLLSPGAMVVPRTQKAIDLSPEAQAVLGLTAATLGPSELLAAILRAPVDLLWFGGIGTYVKAARESNADVGDRANDAHRVDGEQVRAVAIGEGANLGITQAGRVAYAERGGRINTDFIDNSAGVDTSDHEVNIKIALGPVVASGALGEADRNSLLAAMTGEVADLVLADNHAQTLALSIAEAGGPASLASHVELMTFLETAMKLDRAVEGLPPDAELAERRRQGRGLERPELAVLLAYAKMALEAVLPSDALVDDPLLARDLIANFPRELSDRFPDAITGHRLRREIIATRVANQLVNRGGLTLASGLAAEFGVSLGAVAGAFVAARALFDLPGLWTAIDAMPPGLAQLRLYTSAAASLRAQMADLLRLGSDAQPSVLVARLQPGLERIAAGLPGLLRPVVRAEVEAYRAALTVDAPPAVVDRLVMLRALDGAVGVAALAADLGASEQGAAEGYTRLGEALGLDWAKAAASALPGQDPWERLLRADLERAFEQMRIDLVRRITPPGEDPHTAVVAWLGSNAAGVARMTTVIAQARAAAEPTAPMLAHIGSVARGLLTA